MLAVKGHRHGGVKRAGLEIVCQHRRPGHCLQQRPMRANGGHQRENNENLAKPNKHGNNLVKNFTKSNQRFADPN